MFGVTLHWLKMTANTVDKVAESITDFIHSISTEACSMDEITSALPVDFSHVDEVNEASGGKFHQNLLKSSFILTVMLQSCFIVIC